MKKNLTFRVCAVAAALLSVNATAQVSADSGFYYEGYVRYGLHAAFGETGYVAPTGETVGHITGRLGNEANGGEFQLGDKFSSSNGTNWDVAVMIEEYGGAGVDLKKFYAKADNVFASQPQMTVWAGRDFHQRPQSGLNDYFVMSHDGQGGGFTNLSLGSVMLDAAFVGQADGPVADSGNYAITTKLHGFGTETNKLYFAFNYGFATDEANGKDIEDADETVIGNTSLYDGMTSYQLMAVYDMSSDNGWGQGVLRYADGADNSVYTRDDDLSTLFLQWEGSYKLTSDFELGYLAAYHDLENKSPLVATDASRTNTSFIARPMYSWTNIHSTWAEIGYGLVNYDDAGENSAWKLTLSQNISFGEATSGDRPMLRFYATFGDTDNEVTDGTSGNMDTMSLGAMFESWW